MCDVRLRLFFFCFIFNSFRILFKFFFFVVHSRDSMPASCHMHLFRSSVQLARLFTGMFKNTLRKILVSPAGNASGVRGAATRHARVHFILLNTISGKRRTCSTYSYAYVFRAWCMFIFVDKSRCKPSRAWLHNVQLQASHSSYSNANNTATANFRSHDFDFQ